MTSHGHEPNTDTLDGEEYRQVRAEMVDRDAFIRNTYLFSVSAVGALIWAVVSLYLGHPTIVRAAMWWMTYLPALACVPLLFVMAAQRRDLLRGGAYVRVFFEERFGRRGWQARKDQFTDAVRGESNDLIIWFYYFVLLGCVLINRSLKVAFSCSEAALLVFVLCLLVRGHWLFSLGTDTFRGNCLREWRDVLRKES